MAVPRVFISSTFYDLKQVRNNIKGFISDLGYDPIMHENSGVPYTQNTELENDCYHELTNCEIVICIIGNHFGTKSNNNDLSITMNEINTAIKQKKKVYIFISKDVYIENLTYIQNKDNGSFRSAFTDDIRIHEYIEKLKNDTKTHVIEPFETTDEIVSILKKQFAGLFQNLLIKDSAVTEKKTIYDLQETADEIDRMIKEFQKEKNDFFNKFEGSIFAQNRTLRFIQSKLDIDTFSFYAKNLDALDDLMESIGFEIIDKYIGDIIRTYKRIESNRSRYITLNKELFDETDYSFKNIGQVDKLNEYINMHFEEDYDDLPF